MTVATNNILVIDDDPSIGPVIRGVLESPTMHVAFATTATSGRQLLRDLHFDVLILDMVLPDSNGLDFLREIRAERSRLPILALVTGGASETAIEAIKSGAFDCLRRPLDYGILRQRVEEACRLSQARATTADDSILANSHSTLLVGECWAMQQVLNTIGRVARYDGPVLIVGEVGTGKETIARTIHENSSRANGPFEIIHCPALSCDRLESELFVSMDGRPSAFERCRDGTLVLQEISQLPLNLQTRLVQWMRTHGASWGMREQLGCRLIACSSIDIDEAVRNHTFRADLYYQLAGQVIHVPPLRERREDIPLLVQHMVRVVRESGQLPPSVPLHVSRAALDCLVEYDWPGNLDELFSVIRRCLVEGDGSIVVGQTLLNATCGRAKSLPSVPGSMVTNWDEFVSCRLAEGSEDLYAEAINETERYLLELVMQHTDGNQSQAARLLGITRASLRKKLRQYTSRT